MIEIELVGRIKRCWPGGQGPAAACLDSVVAPVGSVKKAKRFDKKKRAAQCVEF